jgi:hypothetical protein
MKHYAGDVTYSVLGKFIAINSTGGFYYVLYSITVSSYSNSGMP